MDGTYNSTSWLLVNISALEADMVLTCHVEHDGQPEAIEIHTVVVTEYQKEQGTATMSGEVSTMATLMAKRNSSFIFFM